MMKRILVPTDGSENSLTAADYAISLARIFSSRIKGLFVKDVKMLTGPIIQEIGTSIGGMVAYGTFTETVREMLEAQADAALNQIDEKCTKAGVSFEREIREGVVSREIIKSAEGEDIIVMGKMGVHAEWRDVFLGTTVEFVVRQIHKPVLIAPYEFKPLKKMLIAYDGSPISEKALHNAAGIAQPLQLPVTLVCVANKEDEAIKVLLKAKTFLESYALSVETIVKIGTDAAACILNVCNDEDNGFNFLVMGAYGHSRLKEMILGSTTVRVMRETDCPILLVR